MPQNGKAGAQALKLRMTGQDANHKFRIQQKASTGDNFKFFHAKFTSGYMVEVIY
jgi:hypothetical protein